MARKIMRRYSTPADLDSRWDVRTIGIGGIKRAGGTLQYVRGNYKFLKGTKLTVVA